MGKSGLYDITLVLVKETANAIGCKEFPGSEELIWLPKSQVEYVEAKKQGYVEVTMPEWLAQEKEFI